MTPADPIQIKLLQLRRRLYRLLGFGVLLAAPALAPAQQPQALPTATLQVGMYKVVAQVAATPQQRQIGLMFRREMPMHEGMLFVFDAAAQQCFWMRNTLLPLSAAFLADDGAVVNIVDMQPQTDDSHCSARPVRFVLEMNQGWFAKRGIKPGTRFSGEVFGR
ncbi:MAG: DUF192 domain-containing protein [Ideonella sp.]|nr:DUF192 domain-containing protein [Ideonella sp.]MCC7457725.1 DUF192 domain-containing protein [Nitrospira sp.]